MRDAVSARWHVAGSQNISLSGKLAPNFEYFKTLRNTIKGLSHKRVSIQQLRSL